MKKPLVAFFSASGVTARVAKSLAQGINADMFEIRPQTPYTTADLDWTNKNSRSSVEMRDRACRPPLAQLPPDLSTYEVIFVGFPVWWYREPSIIDTFMESAVFDAKAVIPFATSGGSGLGDSAQNMQALAPKAAVKAGQLFSSGASQDTLKIWAEKFLK